jgi:hypothetical protein
VLDQLAETEILEEVAGRRLAHACDQQILIRRDNFSPAHQASMIRAPVGPTLDVEREVRVARTHSSDHDGAGHHHVTVTAAARRNLRADAS